jgi:hypothetical protein
MARINVVLAAICLVACGASHRRAEVAGRAQYELVGMSKKDLLLCAGVPIRQQQADDLEFLTYGAGGDSTAVTVATSQKTSVSKSAHRYCEATFVLKDGVVQRVNYQGRTGGMFTKGEQCAFIVENCLR